MSTPEGPNVTDHEVPAFHEPTNFPSNRPIRLAEMPDEWFEGTPQVQEAALPSAFIQDETSAWFGTQAARTRAAQRRLERREGEVRQSAHERTEGINPEFIALGFDQVMRRILRTETGRSINLYDDADTVQEKLERARAESIRPLPYAKGANTRVTPEEEERATRHMQYKKRANAYYTIY